MTSRFLVLLDMDSQEETKGVKEEEQVWTSEFNEFQYIKVDISFR